MAGFDRTLVAAGTPVDRPHLARRSFNLVTRTARIDGLRLGATRRPAPLVAAEQVAVRFPFGLFRGRLDGLDVTLMKGTVTLAREQGQWATIPAAWTRITPGRPPRSLPAFAALHLHA